MSASAHIARANRRNVKRARLTKNERAKLMERQGGLCATWGCVNKPAIAEHFHPVALGNKEKPDCLLCRTCARLKTYGSPGRVGGDIRDIKHIRKLEEKRTQADRRAEFGPKLKSNRKLEGRGFDKSLRKHMNGEVTRRG